MNIRILGVAVHSHTVSPCLVINIALDYHWNLEVPLSISGHLKTSDGKIISVLDENQITPEMSLGLKIYDQETKNKIYDNDKKYLHSYHTNLNAELNSKSINHIEDFREKHPEKSVVFHFHLVVKGLTLPCHPNNIFDQRDNNPFLSLNIKSIGLQFPINQSDWVRNFAPTLRIGKFLLLEFQLPTHFDVDDKWKELYERLMLRVEEIDDAVNHGDWNKALIKARLFYENLKFDKKNPEDRGFKNSLKELFFRDQHSEESFEELFSGITLLFHFLSKFIHDKTRTGQLRPIPIPRKEDAEFALYLSIGLLNMIGRKLSR